MGVVGQEPDKVNMMLKLPLGKSVLGEGDWETG